MNGGDHPVVASYTPHPGYPDYVPGARCRVNYDSGDTMMGDLATVAFQRMGFEVVVGTTVCAGYLRVDRVELV